MQLFKIIVMLPKCERFHKYFFLQLLNFNWFVYFFYKYISHQHLLMLYHNHYNVCVKDLIVCSFSYCICFNYPIFMKFKLICKKNINLNLILLILSYFIIHKLILNFDHYRNKYYQ